MLILKKRCFCEFNKIWGTTACAGPLLVLSLLRREKGNIYVPFCFFSFTITNYFVFESQSYFLYILKIEMLCFRLIFYNYKYILLSLYQSFRSISRCNCIHYDTRTIHIIARDEMCRIRYILIYSSNEVVLDLD
jgi:hypothetical protein